jgi:hypothetical protein
MHPIEGGKENTEHRTLNIEGMWKAAWENIQHPMGRIAF